MMMKLTQVKSGRFVLIQSFDAGRMAEKKLLDMGFLPGQTIKMMNNTGAGPVMVEVKRSKIALGHDLAKKICVKEI